jgi:hypothetical protein
MIRKLFVGSFPQQKEVGEVSSDGTVYGGQGVHKEPIGLWMQTAVSMRSMAQSKYTRGELI